MGVLDLPTLQGEASGLQPPVLLSDISTEQFLSPGKSNKWDLVKSHSSHIQCSHNTVSWVLLKELNFSAAHNSPSRKEPFSSWTYNSGTPTNRVIYFSRCHNQQAAKPGACSAHLPAKVCIQLLWSSLETQEQAAL